jgi:sorting nexin-5/6/32
MNKNFIYLYHKIPIAPPRPEFDLSRKKLEKLRVGEATMPWDEYAKMKEELEEEYLVQFKKSVAMHEYFVCRLASHPAFQKDPNFRRFLEYENEVNQSAKISINFNGFEFNIVYKTNF